MRVRWFRFGALRTSIARLSYITHLGFQSVIRPAASALPLTYHGKPAPEASSDSFLPADLQHDAFRIGARQRIGRQFRQPQTVQQPALPRIRPFGDPSRPLEHQQPVETVPVRIEARSAIFDSGATARITSVSNRCR